MMRTLLWMVLLTGLLACARPVEMGPGFGPLSEHFTEAMRWQDFNGAAQLVVESERPAFLAQFPRNKDLHIVDVAYERVSLDQEQGVAEADLRIEYYLLPSVTVKEWRWTQQWRRVAGAAVQDSLWMVESPPPLFP